MKTFFKKNLKYTFLLGAIFFISCSKDDPDAINEQEFISNVIVTLASEDGETQTVDWDLSEMNSQNINLKVNTNYNVNLSFIWDDLNPNRLRLGPCKIKIFIITVSNFL